MAREPGPLIGIDLGTTFSTVAHIDPHGQPICLPNSEGDLLTSSVVFFEEDGPAIVGKEAAKAGMLQPAQMAEMIKRDMGKEVYHKPVRGKYMPPAALSGVILHRLVDDAAERTGRFERAVVTVPAYFNEPRRKATVDAARMAGLGEVELLNEPTAAALTFGYEMGVFTEQGRITSAETKVPGQFNLLVYDLGGGTFDVTLMRIKDRHFQALVCDGDVQLGGKDWDERIVDYAVDHVREEFDVDLRESPTMMAQVRQQAEEAKKTLSQRAKATLRLQHGNQGLEIELTRADLDRLTEDLLRRTRLTCELVLMEAKFDWNKVDAILLVGGSTRMPMVRDMILELTGIEPSRVVSPDQAVAQGAALYAQMLWGEHAEGKLHQEVRKQWLAKITNVNSHSLGIVGREPGTGKRRVSVLIPKNTQIPHSNSKAFKTRAKGQAKIYMRIVEGESSDPDECALIGECRLEGLPRNLPEGWPVSVSFAYRRDGRIFVEADVKGAAPYQLEIDRNQKISDREAEEWATDLMGETSEEDAADTAAHATLPPSRIKVGKIRQKKPRKVIRSATKPKDAGGAIENPPDTQGD